MASTIIEFVDCDIDPEEIESQYDIINGCLIYDDIESENVIRTTIPLYNILRITEYKD